MAFTKVGMANVSVFFDWAKANVLKEDTPYIKVCTINGTYAWRRPKSKGAPKKAAKKTAKRKGER